MKKTTRWITSVAATIASLPAAYAASCLMDGSGRIEALVAFGNALTLIP